MSSLDVYNEGYYRSSNYSDYLERSDRYKKTAIELATLLHSLNLINRKSVIVDFGCAVGFLMDGFIELGYENVVGVEISQWASNFAKTKGHEVVSSIKELSIVPQLTIALDVFEHMTDEQITHVMNKIKPNALLVRIPTSTDGGKTFSLEISRADPTHINCKTKTQWIEFFKSFGYKTFLRLNLFTIYDTPGVSCFIVL